MNAIRTTTAALALALLLICGDTLAQQGYGPLPVTGVGGRQIHVATTPPGMRTVSSQQRLVARTPHTFTIPAGSATSIIIDGSGFERATVPIPAGSQDLHLNVEMSRPVFEWGIALTALGGPLLIAGIIVGAIWASDTKDERDRCRAEGWDYCYDLNPGAEFGLAFAFWGAPGTALLIPGILMMALDRQRSPRYSWGQPGTGY